MDELTLVARLRDDLPGIDLAGPERLLAGEISAAGEAGGAGRQARGPRLRGARGPSGYRRRLVVVGAVAAVAAVAAAAVIVVQGAGDQAAKRPATATGSPHPSSSAPVPGPAATAAQLVAYATRAAAAARVFDPKPDEWIYTKTLAATSSAGEGGMLFGPPTGKAVEENWTRVDGRMVAWIQHGKLVVTPGGGQLVGLPSTSYRYLDSLPSSPAKVKAIIEASLTAANGVIGEGNVGVFNAIDALMDNMPLPLRLRATLYAILASDPAVHFDPRVADFAGQTGVAFYTYQEGYLKEEIVINPRTYAFMGDRDVAYRADSMLENSQDPSDGTIHVRAGEVTDEDAVLQSGIVQHAGQVLP